MLPCAWLSLCYDKRARLAGIKKLLMIVEMAKQEVARRGQTKVDAEAISTSLTAVGLM